MKNAYLKGVLENVKKRNAGEPEFIQAVTEVLETLEPVIEKRPDLVEAGVVDGSAVFVAPTHGNQDRQFKAVDGTDAVIGIEIIDNDIVGIGHQIVVRPAVHSVRGDKGDRVAVVEISVLCDCDLPGGVHQVVFLIPRIKADGYVHVPHGAVLQLH